MKAVLYEFSKAENQVNEGIVFSAEDYAYSNVRKIAAKWLLGVINIDLLN